MLKMKYTLLKIEGSPERHRGLDHLKVYEFC